MTGVRNIRSARVNCGMSITAINSLHEHYTLGLLAGCSSISDMSERGLLPFSKAHACRLLRQDPVPHQHALVRRLPHAPTGAFLAVDLLTIKHEGSRIEGVGRCYDSSSKGVFWGHTLVSSALVMPGAAPYLLGCDPFLDGYMCNPIYPQLTPTEAMLSVAGDVAIEGYNLRGVLIDAQFTTRLALRSLKHLPAPFVGRFRTNAKVFYNAKKLSVKQLAEQYLPGKARWYPKLRRYVKRLKVVIKEVGEVDLIIIWKAQGTGWYLTALISSFEAGIQEVIRAWDARWSQEVSHRFRKQSLALGKCQCFAFSAQLKHADLVIEAFNLVREERQQTPNLTWKQAKQQAAQRLENALLTEASRMVA